MPCYPESSPVFGAKHSSSISRVARRARSKICKSLSLCSHTRFNFSGKIPPPNPHTDLPLLLSSRYSPIANPSGIILRLQFFIPHKESARMIDVNELRKGVTFELDGNLYK